MATKYSDVIKSSKDLLSKSYNYTNKVEVKSKTSDGVGFTAELGLSKPASALLKADFSTGNFKVDKLQIGTDKKIVGEISMPEIFPNTKLTFKGTDGTRAAADISSNFVAEYTVPGRSIVTADVNAFTGDIDSTATFTEKNFTLGFSGKLKAKPFELADYGAALAYKTKEFTAALLAEKKLQNLTASYFQVVNSTVSVAALAKFPATPRVEDVAIEAGLSYKLAPESTLHAKLNNKGKVGLSYAVEVSKMTKLTFATEVDGSNIASDDHKFGILLNINA